ncbi:MAG: leucine-rich repeat domain-containing protein, partial [Bacteroidales bacterium]|nr:leucine-rich repeat domain-containing protein [Bacteroidales bacterium]
MKHLTFFKLFALVACLTSALSASAYDFSASYNGVTIYYNITSSTNKTVEVTYKEDGYYNYYGGYVGNVTIPSSVYYNGSYYTVTAIGDDAFTQAGGMTSITLPNTITSIGDWAFCGTEMDTYAPAITTITIPNSVKTIGKYAFHRCYSLRTVVIGDGVTTIGESAFQRCYNMNEITLGKSVTSIGAYAFYFNGTYEVNGQTYLNEVNIICKSLTPPTLASNSFVTNSDYYQNPYN